MASLPDAPLKLKAQPREVTPMEALTIEDLFDGPLYEWLGFCVWTDEKKDALLLWEQTTDLESVPCDLIGGVTWYRLCLEWRLADPAYEQQLALYVIEGVFGLPCEHRVLRYTH